MLTLSIISIILLLIISVYYKSLEQFLNSIRKSKKLDPYYREEKVSELVKDKTLEEVNKEVSPDIRKEIEKDNENYGIVCQPADSIKENPKSVLEILSEEEIKKIIYPNSYLTRNMLANITEIEQIGIPQLSDKIPHK